MQRANSCSEASISLGWMSISVLQRASDQSRPFALGDNAPQDGAERVVELPVPDAVTVPDTA